MTGAGGCASALAHVEGVAAARVERGREGARELEDLRVIRVSPISFLIPNDSRHHVFIVLARLGSVANQSNLI